MARISTYTSDTVDKSDKLIGTSSAGETKNFVINDISTFLAKTNAAGVSGQLTYVYHSSSFGGNASRQSGSITATGASSLAFSSVSSLKLSKYPYSKTQTVINYLTGLNNSNIIISNTSNPDEFGVFLVTNVAQDSSETNFYDLTLTYVSGNGNLTADSYYGIIGTAIGSVTLNGTQTLTNKTLTSPVLNTGVSGTAIKDEDDMSSNSATHIATQQSIKAYVDNQLTASDLDFQGDSGGALSIDLDSETLDIAGDGAGISTAGSGNQITISGNHDALTNFVANEHIDHTSVTLTAGTGLSGGGTIASNRTFAVEAAQTGITSLLNTSLVIGRDSDNDIDFATDNQIIFRVDGGDNVIFKTSGEIEATSLDISGDVDVDGTLEADAITVDGTALDTHIAGVTVTNATNSAHTLVTDNENTNEDNPITFVEGATTSTGNIGLEMDGDFHYNPSTGRLTASQLAGTLQTASQTNITGVGTISTGVWNGTAIASAYLDSDTMHLSVAQTITGEKTVDGSDKFYFRDSAIYVHSDADGYLEMVADTGVSLKIGSDEQIMLTDGAFTPTSDSDVDLGSSSKYWKDSYIDTITTTGNVVVGGNLTVSGTTTTVNSTTVAIADSMLKLAKDQADTADAVDFGFYGQYGDSGTHKYAGIFRDLSASGDPWTFFDGLQAEPGTTVNTSGTGYDLADISAGGITAADGFTGTLLTAAQGNITSLGTLSTLTVDNVIINATNIGHTDDTDLITLADGVFTVAGEIDGTTLDISGNADIAGTTNLDAVDIDGNVQIDGTLTVGVDDTGYDVKLFGATSGDYILWDESDNELETAGGATINIVKDKLKIGGTAVTTTAAELNLLDTAVANTVVNSKAVIYGSSGEISGGAGAFSGNVTLAATKSLRYADDKIIIGNTNSTLGTTAISIGYDADSTGDTSIGLGYNPQATGVRSIAIGYAPDATGTDSVSIGYNINATGSQTVAIGYNDSFSEASTLCTDLDMLARTSDGAILNLQTSDTTVTDGSVLGSIKFSAPEEASGTDAILTGAEITAVAEGTFATDNNATELLFKVGASEAAATALTIASTKDATFAGSVGIGTAPGSYMLHLNGTGDAIRVESTNSGSGGAQMDLMHYSASPADEDIHGFINFGGYYTGTTVTTGSQIRSYWTDVSERHGRLEFWTADTTTAVALTLAHDKSATFAGDVAVGFQSNKFIGSSAGNGLYFDGTGNYGMAVNSSLGLGLIFESDGGTAKDFFIGTGNSDPDSATKLLTITQAGNATFAAAVDIETGISLESGVLVIKNATGDSSGLRIFQDSSDAAKIYNNYAGTLELGLSNTTMFKIANSGGNTMLFGNGGADGYTLPYDQNPGYSNFSAGGFGFLFREAYDSYLTGNVYYYQTGGAQSWRYKFGSAGGNVLSLDGGNYRFNTVGSGSADAVASFTERFTILQAGNVGVGVAAPRHKLEVTGNICINSASTTTGDPTEIDKIIFEKQHPTAGDGYDYILGEIRSYTTGGYSGGLKFYTGKSTGGGSYASTHAMTLDQNQLATFVGYVGTGGHTPDCGLEVYGADNTGAKIKITNTNATDNEWSIYANYNTQDLIFLADSTEVLRLEDGPSATFAGNIRTADDTVVRTGYDSTGGGPAIQLNYSHSTGDYLGNISSEYSSGGIMIGYGCHGKVGAAATFQSSYDNFSYGHSAFNCDGQQFEWWHDSSNSQTTVGSDVPNMVQIMTLDRAGNLMLGKTTVTTTGAGSFFETVGIGYGRVNFTSTVTTGYPAVFYHDSGSGSPSAVGSISNSSSATSFNTSSDYRLKEDLKDFNGLDKISKIKMYDFKWKNDNSRSYGVLAHELQEIIPQAVTGEKDGMIIQKETNDKDEVIDKEVINPQNVDYSKIVPVLVQSIQDQQEIIEDLKKRIETLEG